MGTLGERVRRLLHGLTVAISRLSAFWQQSAQLHTARFSHPHELETIRSDTWHNEAGLLLGVSQFKQVLSVRSTPKRREIGNLLVTAPTRGGKGLMAVSQILTWGCRRYWRLFYGSGGGQNHYFLAMALATL